MEKSAELLDRVAASEPITRKLGAIQPAQWPVQFSHVIQPAQPFLAAVIGYALQRHPLDKRQTSDSTIWIFCPSVHSQEVFYESLLNWQPDALMIEVHDSPEQAKSDGNQALTPEIFAELVPRLRAVAAAIGRSL